MTLEYMLAFAGLIFFALWLNELLKGQRLRGVIRAGLRKAERDNCPTVRIPYNQLAEELGWKVEFEKYKYRRTPGRKAGTTQVRTSTYPVREVK